MSSRCLHVACGRRRDDEDAEAWREPWWEDYGTCSMSHTIDYYGKDVLDSDDLDGVAHRAWEIANRPAVKRGPSTERVTGEARAAKAIRGIAGLDRRRDETRAALLRAADWLDEQDAIVAQMTPM